MYLKSKTYLKLQPFSHLASLSTSSPPSENKTKQDKTPPWMLIKKQKCFSRQIVFCLQSENTLRRLCWLNEL
jgi:hypothetical protein